MSTCRMRNLAEAGRDPSITLILARDAADSGDEGSPENALYGDVKKSLPLFYDYDDQRIDSDEASTLRYAAKGKGRAVITHIVCCTCFNPKPYFDVLQLNCKHEEDHAYCRDCLLDPFESSMTNSTLFPPRCYGVPITLEAAKPFLTAEFIVRFEEKVVELSTINPCYCSNRACAKSINPSNIKSSLGVCGSCRKRTCTTCKAPPNKDSALRTLMSRC